MGISGILCMTLAACTTITVDMPAAQPVPARFAEVPPALDGAAATAAPPQDIAHWWRGVADPTLQALIEQGLQANTDIRIATAHVREARTVVSRAESALYPALSAYGGIGRDKVNRVSPPGLPAPLAWPEVHIPMGTFDGSGFAAAWEVDVFGSRRSDAEAARQAAMATQERLHGAQMVVAADIASNYIEARSIERRMDVLTRSLAEAQLLQRYAQGRFDAGQATRLDIDRVQVQREALDAQQVPLQALLAARLRRLAVLTGRNAAGMTTLPSPTAQAPADASVIPDVPPGILPSEVLARRPDVRGAADAVRARAAQLGSAKAEVLPKFYLGFLTNDGRLAVGQTSASSGFSAWGLGATLPIFAGGRIKAGIEAADAQLQAAAAQYDQAVMNALEDVDNAYGARRALDERAALLGTAWHTAQAGAKHADQLFREGSGLMQAVLEARLGALQREDELIQAQTLRALTTVMLYKALGGGWSAGTPQATPPNGEPSPPPVN